MGDNLDKVFLQVYWGNDNDSKLEWALDHFDNNKTQLMIFPHYYNYSEKGYQNRTKSYWLPRCAEKNFKVEVLIPYIDEVGGDYAANLRKVITRHGINKLVVSFSDTTRNAISKVFDEASHLSCKIWFIDWKSRKLVSTRHFGPLFKVLVECENLEKIIMDGSTRENVEKQMLMLKNTIEDEISRRNKIEYEVLMLMKRVDDETSRREKVEDELLMLKNIVADETSRRENVEKELLSMAKKTKLNEQEIDHLNHEIDRLNQEIDPLEQSNTLSTIFSFQELEQATENFNGSLKIGEGEYAHVHKGTFRGTTVAIKKFKPESKPSLSVLRQEVVILSTVKHPNLVTFLGVCSDPPAFVYEFLSRGSLHNFLNNEGNTMPLPWQLRTRIIGEVCVALVFLHLNKPNPILHGNLMPDNVLLDANFTSKLDNFGHTNQVDTDMTNSYPARYLAYMDPKYLTTEEMTLESDVYAFGVLILHLLTGKSRFGITKIVEKAIGNDNLCTIIDESAGKWPLQHATELAKIGVWCANAQRSKRPNLVNEVRPIIGGLVKSSKEIMYDPNSLGQPFK